jgi:hypothetical protein
LNLDDFHFPNRAPCALSREPLFISFPQAVRLAPCAVRRHLKKSTFHHRLPDE